jgi:peptide/nickel transport system permease protein
MSVADLSVAPESLNARPDAGAPGRRRRARGGRFVWYVVTVIALVTVNFFLPRAMPGDPIAALTADSATGRGGVQVDPAARAKIAHYYGLDRPLAAQYGHYMVRLVHGDLGFSIRYNVPVARLVAERMGWTLLLISGAMVIAVSIGMVAGIHSGWRRERGVDRGLLGLFIAIGNFPVFVVASLALIWFAVKLGWFPLVGARTPFVNYGPLHRVLDVAHHLVLPASVMALQFIFLEFLVMRGGMVSELGSDYLLLGRAKGIAERGLKYRYAARNALLPVVTVVALDIRTALGGSIFVERVFAYPGLGRLMFDAIDFRDYPTMQGCFLVMSLIVVGVNLLTDLLYPRLDPRVAR